MSTNDKPQPAWYVLHTRSRFEQVVFDGLDRKSIEPFLPKMTVVSKRRDRRMTIRVPIFPGYIFVKSDLTPTERLEIVKTIGVVRFIGNNEGPLSVPEESIASLRIMVSSDAPIITGNQLRKGDKVMVVSGPFAGIIGIFVTYRGSDRVVVSIEALGQYAAVSVAAENVEKMP